MDISATLAANLALLTEALDGEQVDLETALGALAADLAVAVTSYHGMTMTVVLASHDVSFTVRQTDGGPVVAASLLIPLTAVTSAHRDSTLVLYAATPGAFVDLAADLSHALGLDLARFVIDGHLTVPASSTEMVGLAGHLAINQAIGILIDRGHSPESANRELHRLAAAGDASLQSVAASLIREVGGGSSG